MKKVLVCAAAILTTTPAFSYGDHSSWSSYRGSYYSDAYQFTTGVEVLQTALTVTDPSTDTSTVTQYRGLGFKTSVGTELARFVRFDVFNTYQDISADPLHSIRGAELGGDIRLSFAGPVANLNFGLGLFGSSLVNQTPTSSYRYYGQGCVGLFEIEKFLSPASSFSFTVAGKQQTLKPESSSVLTRSQLNTLGISFGVTLWLKSNTY